MRNQTGRSLKRFSAFGLVARVLVAILASGTAATADPIPTNTLVLHLKPETLSALADDTSVTNWPDSSPLGNDAYQANASDQPTFKTSILNGYGVVRFVYSNSEFLTNNAPTTFASGTEFSAFAVVGNVSAGAHRIIFGGRTGIGTIYGRANSGFRIQSESTTDASGHSDMTAAFQFRSFARDTGNQVTAYVDGSLDDGPNAIAGIFDLHGVGARLINPLYLDGDIAEVLIYSNELSATDRQLVEGSLAWKYGLEGNLPGGHPHKDADPNLTGPLLNVADTSVTEGDSGTTAMQFDVTLSAITSATVTVQFTTSNGTATAGSDYVATNGTLSFSAAGTNQITVLVNGDTTAELDKTLFLVLSDPTNATIQSASIVQGTIVDDDLFPPAATAIPTNDLVLWLRPGTLDLELTNAQDVASWRDCTIPREDSLSGSSPPTLRTNILNGYSAVRFSGGNLFLTNNAPTAFAVGTEFSAFAVVGNVSGGTQQPIFGGPPVAGFGTIYGRANGTFRIQSETAADATGHSDMTAAFQIRSFARDTGNTVSAYLDGTLDDTPSAVAGTFDLHTVGGRLGTGAPLYLDGDIVEVLIYSSELSADDRQLVEGSLAWKYGLEGNLPGGHTWENTNPNLATPLLNVADTSVAEGDSGTTSMQFDVSLSAITSATVTVQFTTSNGTATAGSDYVATNGTLSFTAAGTKQVAVLVNGDTTAELDKTLFLVLSDPTNAVFQSASTVQGTIVDDDPFPPAGSAIPTGDLVLWLRPGTLVELTNAQDVVSWRDSSVPREDSHGSTNSPPTLQKNILNGYSAVRFNGSSQYLTNNAPTAFAAGTEFSAFAVVGNVGGGANQPIFGGSPASSFGTIYGRANGTFRIQSETANDASGHSNMTGAFQFRSFARDTGNTVSAYVDGTLDDTPSAVAGTFDLHTVGGRLGAGPLYLDGDIVEVLIYSSELSAGDRQLVEGSLAWKYGLEGNLPGGHPHKDANPNGVPDVGTVIIIR